MASWVAQLTKSLKKAPLDVLPAVWTEVQADSTLSVKTKSVVQNRILKVLEDGTIAIEKAIAQKVAFREAMLKGEIKDFVMPSSTWDHEESIDFLTKTDYAWGDKLLLCAAMGTGKNYFWTNLPENHEYANYIMLVPYLTIVGQQGSENEIQNDKVLTYDCARILLQQIQNKYFNPSNTILIIDEAHNLLFSSYRLEALHLVRLLCKKKWKKIIFQSATVRSDSFDDIITFDRKIKRTSNRQLTLNYTRAFSLSYTEQKIEIYKEIIKLPQGQKSIILYNNKDECEKFAAYLRNRGLKVVIINAETTKKGCDIARDLAQNSNFCMNDVDVLLGTNSLVEGVSIQDDIAVGNIFIMDFASTHPDHIKQLAGRFRKASEINVIHYCSTSKNNWVKNKEKWMETRRNDAMIDYIYAKEWVKKMPNGAGLEIAAEMDNILTPLEHARKKLEFKEELRSPIRKFYDTSADADFLLSYKPDLASHGIYYCREEQKYIASKLGDLFAYADCVKKQFYADYKFANKLMKDMGFNIIERDGLRPKISDDEIDELNNEHREIGRGIKNQRAASAKPIIDLINSFDDDANKDNENENYRGFMASDILHYFTEKYIDWDEFTLRIYNVFNAAGNAWVIPKEDLLNAINFMISGQKNDTTIANELLASTSEYGIRAELRKQFPKGTEIPRDKLSAIFEGCIQKMVEHVAASVEGFSPDDAFRHLNVTETMASNSKDSIVFENGKVIANLVNPLNNMKKFIPKLKSKQKGKGKNRVYVPIVT